MSKLAKRLEAHFVACAAAAGALTAGVAQNAEAGIVYSGLVNIVVPDTIDGVYLNVVTGANSSSAAAVPGWDLNPYSAVSPGTNFNLWAADTSTWFAPGGVIGGPYPIAANTVIGPPNTNFFRPGGGTNVGTQVTLNADNLFGFKFTNEGTAMSHYGWIRINFGADPGTRTIVDWAYEDVAGGTIPAGVPAPGSLALLALGALGVAGRRRK